LSTAVGDEGGFNLAGGTEDALDIKLSVENAGYTFGDEIMIFGAAAEFFVNMIF
jgi:enolase